MPDDEFEFEGHRFRESDRPNRRCLRCGVLIGVAAEAPWPVECKNA